MTLTDNRALTFDEAVETWIMKYEGWIKDRIAAKFDVNVLRLYEVWEEKKHVGSRQKAEEIINSKRSPDSLPVKLKVHVRKRQVKFIAKNDTSKLQTSMDI